MATAKRAPVKAIKKTAPKKSGRKDGDIGVDASGHFKPKSPVKNK